MIEEGFDERHMIEALIGRIRVLEEYPDEKRCLVLGRFRFTAGGRIGRAREKSAMKAW